MPSPSPVAQLIWMQAFLHLLCSTFSDGQLISLINGNFSEGPTFNGTDQEIQIQSLPGWHIGGIVQYIKAGGNITLPDGGHGVQLGKGGSVNQTFLAQPGSVYALTFSLASAGDNCSTPDYLNVGVSSQGALFLLEERYSDSWETYAWGFKATSDQANLIFYSESGGQQDPNITCGPVLDTVYIKQFNDSEISSGNMLVNGGFEEGPYTLPTSSYGVLIQSITDLETSPLPGWRVGPSVVRYIDSGHFFVPQGSAAIELVSGPGAGISQSVSSVSGTVYILNFELGNANDTCVGNMTVEVSAGTTAMNFTYDSLGKGGSEKFTMKFIAAANITNISFVSTEKLLDANFEFCGPVVDNITLSTSGYTTTVVGFSFLIFICIAANIISTI